MPWILKPKSTENDVFCDKLLLSRGGRLSSCVKMADEVASVAMTGNSTASTKAKTTFSEEETERIITLGSEEEVLFNSLYKDYFKHRPAMRARVIF